MDDSLQRDADLIGQREHARDRGANRADDDAAQRDLEADRVKSLAEERDRQARIRDRAAAQHKPTT